MQSHQGEICSSIPLYEIIICAAIENTKRKGGKTVAKNKFKQHFMAKQIEHHCTAAWANIEKTKPESNVTIPSENQVRNAKEYVDSNEK